MGAQHRHIVLFRHLETLRQRLVSPCNHEHRNFVGQKAVEDYRPLLVGQLLQIRHLHRAADVDPHRLKMVKEPRQMKARTAHIVDRDMDFFIVGGFVEKVQVELAYELRQGDRIRRSHRRFLSFRFRTYTAGRRAAKPQ